MSSAPGDAVTRVSESFVSGPKRYRTTDLNREITVGCTGTSVATEYDFVVSCRDREHQQCRGPLIELSFSGYELVMLEDSLGSDTACEALWAGWSPDRVAFGLCAAHWMDLSYLAGMNARLNGRRDWLREASHLLDRLFTAAHWDAKEIANMLMWRRVQLT